eukprot:Skav221405  [mRNA]  locus=scaffold1621:38420:45877:- [translate_table: standard]
MHLRGANHVTFLQFGVWLDMREKKTKARQGLGAAGQHVLTEEEETNGIYAGDGTNGTWAALAETESVLKKHSKEEIKLLVGGFNLGMDPFERLWNLPDYVELNEEHQELKCTMCTAKAATVLAMYQHLHGERHRKKALTKKVEDVIWIKERNQLEYVKSGRPVRRTGFQCKKSDKSTPTEPVKTNGKAVEADAAGGAVGTAAKPLPPGWAMSWDEASKSYYYWLVPGRWMGLGRATGVQMAGATMAAEPTRAVTSEADHWEELPGCIWLVLGSEAARVIIRSGPSFKGEQCQELAGEAVQ